MNKMPTSETATATAAARMAESKADQLQDQLVRDSEDAQARYETETATTPTAIALAAAETARTALVNGGDPQANYGSFTEILKVFPVGTFVFGIGEHIGCSQVFFEYGVAQPFSFLSCLDPRQFRVATDEEVKTALFNFGTFNTAVLEYIALHLELTSGTPAAFDIDLPISAQAGLDSLDIVEVCSAMPDLDCIPASVPAFEISEDTMAAAFTLPLGEWIELCYAEVTGGMEVQADIIVPEPLREPQAELRLACGSDHASGRYQLGGRNLMQLSACEDPVVLRAAVYALFNHLDNIRKRGDQFHPEQTKYVRAVQAEIERNNVVCSIDGQTLSIYVGD